jgi:hypothetical protein
MKEGEETSAARAFAVAQTLFQAYVATAHQTRRK